MFKYGELVIILSHVESYRDFEDYEFTSGHEMIGFRVISVKMSSGDVIEIKEKESQNKFLELMQEFIGS